MVLSMEGNIGLKNRHVKIPISAISFQDKHEQEKWLSVTNPNSEVHLYIGSWVNAIERLYETHGFMLTVPSLPEGVDRDISRFQHRTILFDDVDD